MRPPSEIKAGIALEASGSMTIEVVLSGKFCGLFPTHSWLQAQMLALRGPQEWTGGSVHSGDQVDVSI